MNIQRLIIHCSDYGKPHTASDIHDWHRKRGWAGIGYHDIIDQDGLEHAGRPHYWQGAHAKSGGWNRKSLGVCLLAKRIRTDAQMKGLKAYVLRMAREYPNILVCGHRDVEPNKTCPNFDVRAWIKADPDMRHVRTL